MDYAKFENFQEFYDAVEMGLDIEFFIDGIRYNISWQNNKPLYVYVLTENRIIIVIHRIYWITIR